MSIFDIFSRKSEKDYGTDELAAKVTLTHQAVQKKTRELEFEIGKMQAKTKEIERGFNIPAQD